MHLKLDASYSVPCCFAGVSSPSCGNSTCSLCLHFWHDMAAQPLQDQHAKVRTAVSQIGTQAVSSLLIVSSNVLQPVKTHVQRSKGFPAGSRLLGGLEGLPGGTGIQCSVCFDSAHSLCNSLTLMLFQFYGIQVHPDLYWQEEGFRAFRLPYPTL